MSETGPRFLNQVKLCLFSLRRNGGALADVPVTVITNGDALSEKERAFLRNHFSPVDFAASPRLGAIPHTSKLNVFYSIHPATYDVLMFMDCDTVVARDLDGLIDPIIQGDVDFLCRRGGESDRNQFVDFDNLVTRFCGDVPERKVESEGAREWPMFNSGVFLATPDAVLRVRRNAVEFTYEMFNEWQRTSVLLDLPPSIRASVESMDGDAQRFDPIVHENWSLEQGALALSCIQAGVRVRYLDETYNHWGGDEDLHILHCFKSVYQFDRRTMFDPGDPAWVGEYRRSDVPGKRILASLVQDYRRAFPTVVDRSPEDDLPPDWSRSDIHECVSNRDARLCDDIARVTRSLPIRNVFNPSFYLDDAVRIISFRAIRRGETEISSYLSIEDGNGHSVERLGPSEYPGLGAPRLIDPKIVRLGDSCFVTFNSGWVPDGNDIFIMKIWPERDRPRRLTFPGRARQERNWAFFSSGGDIYALYWINPTRILRLSHETADAWVMEPFHERDSANEALPTDLTIGTQMSRGQRYHYFVAHQKRDMADKKAYLGRLCRFDVEERSVSAGRYWLSHSLDSIRGSRLKHNTNLHSCTYFSGLQVQGDLIRIAYGINDIDYGASVHHPDTL